MIVGAQSSTISWKSLYWLSRRLSKSSAHSSWSRIGLISFDLSFRLILSSRILTPSNPSTLAPYRRAFKSKNKQKHWLNKKWRPLTLVSLEGLLIRNVHILMNRLINTQTCEWIKHKLHRMEVLNHIGDRLFKKSVLFDAFLKFFDALVYIKRFQRSFLFFPVMVFGWWWLHLFFVVRFFMMPGRLLFIFRSWTSFVIRHLPILLLGWIGITRRPQIEWTLSFYRIRIHGSTFTKL